MLPGCFKNTMDGPNANFSLPTRALVAVGSNTAGPAPQIILPDFAGEKKAVARVSPIPLFRCSVAVGWDVNGIMTRRTTFVLGLAANGMTGWKLSRVALESRSPIPKSQLP